MMFLRLPQASEKPAILAMELDSGIQKSLLPAVDYQVEVVFNLLLCTKRFGGWTGGRVPQSWRFSNSGLRGAGGPALALFQLVRSP